MIRGIIGSNTKPTIQYQSSLELLTIYCWAKKQDSYYTVRLYEQTFELIFVEPSVVFINLCHSTKLLKTT